jgi:hypothetical protein
LNYEDKNCCRKPEAFDDLMNTKTASAIIETQPFESIAHCWGEEIYFDNMWSLKLRIVKKCLVREILPTGRLAKACASSLVLRLNLYSDICDALFNKPVTILQ